MEISFTKNQYQTLLQLLYPGEWVVSLTTHRLSLTAKPQVGSWQKAVLLRHLLHWGYREQSPPPLPPSLELRRSRKAMEGKVLLHQGSRGQIWHVVSI